jgi:hypothetical protein
LATLARERGTDGLHFVLGGSPNITRSAEELRKQIQLPRFGIALQTADTVQSLNGRVPRSLAQAELPPGRGFVVRSGRTYMLQIATPYEDDENQEAILDRWVKQIRDRYPGQKAIWSLPEDVDEEYEVEITPLEAQKESAEPPAAPAETGDVEPKKLSESASASNGQRGEDEESDPPPPIILSAVPDSVNVDEVKAQLRERGFDDSLMKLLDPVDVINVALEMKILTDEDLN